MVHGTHPKTIRFASEAGIALPAQEPAIYTNFVRRGPRVWRPCSSRGYRAVWATDRMAFETRLAN